MPLTECDCPYCGEPIHTDGMLLSLHAIGCGRDFPSLRFRVNITSDSRIVELEPWDFEG